MPVEPDPMRFALIPPERCPMCLREANAAERSMRARGLDDKDLIAQVRRTARCKGHR